MSGAVSPYGKARIGRVRPAPGEVDAQAIDVRRDGQLAGREAESYQGVPPVKKAPWEWQVPLYFFWLGGVASGSWLAATAEDVAGSGDRAVVRAGRYLAFGCVLGGTVLLIDDLGRPERFLHMLRIVRPRSAMSLGAWGLAAFGVLAGAGAVLQAAEDGFLGERARLSRLSRRGLGRGIHLAGLPFALFEGAYPGGLLAGTATPSWSRAGPLLAPLMLLSAASTGAAAVASLATRGREATHGARRRLARVQAIALAGELTLVGAERRVTAGLPSARDATPATRVARWLTATAGVAVPLVLATARGWGRAGDATARTPPRPPRRTGAIASGLTLAGGLALRYLVVSEGYRSADTPADTWTVAAAGSGRGGAVPSASTAARSGGPARHRRPSKETLARAAERAAIPAMGRAGNPAPRPTPPGTPAPGATAARAEVTGRIAIVQEDRIRVLDNTGRGYLFVVRKRAASLDTLERWRDHGIPIRVVYTGTPDAGALAVRLTPVDASRHSPRPGR